MPQTTTELHNAISQRIVREDFRAVLAHPDASPHGADLLVLIETLVCGALLAVDTIEGGGLDLKPLARSVATRAYQRADAIRRERAN